MFKKMMLAGLLVMVFAGSLFANGVDSKGEDPKLRQMAVDFLIENGFKEDVDSEYFEIEVLPNDKMIIPYEGYKAYSIRFHGDDDEWFGVTVLIKDDKTFSPFYDFNKILKNEGIKIDSTNAFKVINDFLKLKSGEGKTLHIEKMNWVNEEYKFDHRTGIFEKFIFNVEVYAYQKINGLKLKYLIGIKKGYIIIIQTEIIDLFKGDYIKNPSKIPLKKKYLNTLEISQNRENGEIEIENHSNEIITFDKKFNPYDGTVPPDSVYYYRENNIIIKENNLIIDQSERTINIDLNGFTEYANTTKRITSWIWDTTDNFLIIYDDNIAVNFDGSGNAVYEDFVVPDTISSGVYSMIVAGNQETRTDFYIYETKTNNLTPSYPSIVYFYDQITNFDEPEIETVSNNVRTSIAQVYQTEVNEWNFPSPANIDLDDNFDLYITAQLKSAATSTGSHSIFKLIKFGYPVIENFRTTYNYATDMDVIQTVLSHEFLHSVQYHWSHIFEHWGGGINYEFISEGQATFIQSLYMDKIAGAGSNGEEYLNGRFFQTKSNEYLTSKLNASVTEQSYNYCLFWRFLFETNIIGSDAEKLEILTDLLGASYGVDPVSCSEIMFNSALSHSIGGIYNSFDEALIAFAKNAYFNNISYGNWNPNPSDDFYITPNIETTNTLSPNVRNNISFPGAIAPSFGIDYHQINIDNDVNAAAVKISVAETNRADFALQVWSMQDAAIVDSFSVEISESSDMATVSFRTLNTANKFIINVVRLDANEDNPSIDDTYTIEVYPGTLVSGNQSGNWVFEDSPYLLDGNVTVPAGQTLNIAEGISVFALDNYAFTVNGILNANGIEGAMVKFSSINTTTGWQGLKFYNNNRRINSELHFTIFEYGRATGGYPVFFGGAVYCDDSSPVFEDCLFQYNTADGGGGAMGLYNWSSPTIRRTRFVNNSAGDGGAIYIWNPEYCSSFPLFEESIFENNTASNSGGAINCYQRVYPVFINCTFNQNTALARNGGGALYCYDTCNVNFFNTIMWQDTSPELNIDYNCSVEIHDCDLTEGEDSYILGQYSWVTFEGNILESNPQFVDGANGNYNLKWSSPCIDKGSVARIESENRSYQRNRDDDGTLPDIGARYYYQPDYVNQPTDLTVSTENDSLNLDWVHGDGAIFYKIYESIDPYNSFTVIDSVFGNTEYSKPVSNNKNFYKITGANNRPVRK